MKKFLQIFSVLLLSCLSVVAIGTAKPQLARAAVAPAGTPSEFINPSDGSVRPGVECDWQSTNSLKCGIGVGADNDGLTNATYSLDPALSLESGHLVFIADFGNGSIFGASTSAGAKEKFGYVHVVDDFSKVSISTSPTDATSGYIQDPIRNDSIPIDLTTKPDDEKTCALSNLTAGCTLNWDQNNKRATDMSQENLDKVKAIYTGIKESAANAASCQADAGPLGFFLCPLSDMVTGIVKWALDIFTSLLELPPLKADNKDLTDAVGSIRNLANAFYVIIFLIIIFANFIAIPGLDNYSVKKLLPKLITVIILTQFSYLICSVMVDLGNIAGQTIPTAIATTVDSEGFAKAGGEVNEWIAAELLNPIKDINDNLSGDLETSKVGAATAGIALTGVGLYFFGFIIVLVSAVIIIISLFYLMMRWFGIMLLTIFAPIAFAAWVLPNTEKFAKMWIVAFVKLTLMYVLVMSMLVSATIIKNILMGSASALGPFVAIFIPLIAIALVPKCLKVSSSMLTAAGKMAADSKAGKVGAAAAKKSGQEGKLAELKGKGFGALSKATPGKAGKGFGNQQAATKARVAEANSKLYEGMDTERLQKLSAAELANGGKPGAATKQLTKNYQKARVDLKSAQDAGLTYSPEQIDKYDKGAVAAGGQTHAETLVAFEAAANKPQAVYTVTQPQASAGAGGGGGGGGGTAPITAPNPPPGGGKRPPPYRGANPKTPPPYRGAKPQWQAAPGSFGTPPNPTPPSNPPLGPPPPPPGGSGTP